MKKHEMHIIEHYSGSFHDVSVYVAFVLFTCW